MLEAPPWYKLSVAEIARVREYYASERTRLSKQEDEAVSDISALIRRAREGCSHQYPALFKEALTSHAHAEDLYVCTNCTETHHGRHNIFPSTEIIQVTQEQLMRFFCK